MYHAVCNIRPLKYGKERGYDTFLNEKIRTLSRACSRNRCVFLKKGRNDPERRDSEPHFLEVSPPTQIGMLEVEELEWSERSRMTEE